MEQYDLNNILDLDISDEIKEEIKAKFNKRIFYDDNNSCKIGTLVGIKSNTHYIIHEINGNINYVPIWKSLTIL